jgi:hypothetical protein
LRDRGGRIVQLVSTLGAAARRSERRRHFRAPVSMAVRCRAADGDRRSTEQPVRAVDISRGGIRIHAPEWMQRDDVVEVDVGPVAVRGVVVGVSAPDASPGRQAHVVFVGLTPRVVRQLDRLVSHCYVPA